MVMVRIPGPLRRITDNADRVNIEANSINSLVSELESAFAGMSERLLDESGKIRHFINIYVNGEDIQFLAGMDTELNSGDEVSIVPAVAGGS